MLKFGGLCMKRCFKLFFSKHEECQWLNKLGVKGYRLEKISRSYYYFEHEKNTIFSYSIEYLDLKTLLEDDENFKIAICLAYMSLSKEKIIDKEIKKSIPKTKTEQEILSRQNGVKYDYKVFGITMERGKLYSRINLRVDLMIKKK